MKKINIFKYKNENLEYIISYVREEKIRLHVFRDYFELYVPKNTESWEIEKFIFKNINIIKKYRKLYQYIDKYLIAKDGYIVIFGKKIKASFIDGNIDLKKHEFKIYETYDETIKHMYKKLALMYEKNLKALLIEYGNIMDIKPDNFSIRLLYGRWGQCDSINKTITINVKALHFDKEIISSIIVHELAHLIHKNHSDDFMKLVYKVLPNYNELQKRLNGR